MKKQPGQWHFNYYPPELVVLTSKPDFEEDLDEEDPAEQHSDDSESWGPDWDTSTRPNQTRASLAW